MEREICKKCNGRGEYLASRWGLKCAGGSMGIGFSMAVGMARARKALGKEGKVAVLISDGEAHCGNVWESARKVVQENLTNLFVIMDKNGFCAMGKTDDILKIEPEEMFSKWDIKYIDGHAYEDIEDAILYAKKNNKSTAIIARTVKGYPISFMSSNNNWHYRNIDKKSYELAAKELGQ